MQGNKMNGGWMGGEKGEWSNGQILILSKQEDKENKMENGREKKQRVSNPSNALDERGNGSKCSNVSLEIPESGRDAIRRRP